jgi:hypothetical protein
MKSTVSWSISESSSWASGVRPRLGVAVGGGGIAVLRAEVALAVDQRIAQREILRHAHQRLVGGGVAVRVELAEHLADDARGLGMLDARREAQLVHRVENAPLHRLLAVLHVRDRAAAHDAHGVGEIAALGKQRHVDEVVVRVDRVAATAAATAAARACHRAAAGALARLAALFRLRGPFRAAFRGCLRFRRFEEIQRSVVLVAPRAPCIDIAHTSASTVLPFSSIHSQRFSDSFFDMSMLKSLKVWLRSSMRTLSSRRVSGFNAVSHNCSGFISPSPLKRWIETDFALHPVVAGAIEYGLQLVVVERVDLLRRALAVAGHVHLVERRAGNVDVSLLDQLREVAVEERQEQHRDVRPVHVRVGHRGDLAVAQAGEVGVVLLVVRVDAQRDRDVVNLGIGEEQLALHLPRS